MRGVAQDVIGAGRLLDPQRPCRRQRLHPLDRLVDVPDLVGVDHQDPVVADLLADDADPADVVGQVGADLDLEVPPAGGDAFAAQAADLVVGVAEPARRRRVGGIAVGAHLGLARGALGACRRRMSSASSGVSASVM